METKNLMIKVKYVSFGNLTSKYFDARNAEAQVLGSNKGPLKGKDKGTKWLGLMKL